MKKLYSLILMAAIVAISASAKVEVYVQTTNGEAPYIWTWGTDVDLNGGLSWPGNQQLTEKKKTSDGKEWFYKAFDVDMMSLLFLSDLDLQIQSPDYNGVITCGYYIFDPEMGDCEDVTDTYYKRPDYDLTKIPKEVKFLKDETFAYFVKPATWGSTLNVWAWDADNDNEQLSGATNWPGAKLGDKIGVDGDGLEVYLWKLDQTKFPNRKPTHIIFNDGSKQTSDMEFVNAGYYGITGLLTIIKSTGVESVKVNEGVTDNNVYTIDGRLVNRNADLNGLAKGFYIVGGKKVLVK